MLEYDRYIRLQLRIHLSPWRYTHTLLLDHILEISVLVEWLERLWVRDCPAWNNIYARDNLLHRNFDFLAIHRVLLERKVLASCRQRNAIPHRYIFHFEYSCRLVSPAQAFPNHTPNFPF